MRRFARELGVDIYDVKASGPGGRITEDDVKAHVKKGQRPDKMAAPGTKPMGMTAEPQLPDFSRWGEIETVELDGVRRITAANMSVAWRTVPHVTQFDQADITGLQEFINKNTTDAQYLTILYKAFFNRDPDQGGWDAWMAELAGGKDRGFVLNGFLGSQEFRQLCEDYGITPF